MVKWIVIPTRTGGDWQRLLARPKLHWKKGASAMTAVVILVAAGCAEQSVTPVSHASAFIATVIPPKSNDQFHFPYILRVPSDIETSKTSYILVEPNNSGGVSSTLEEDTAAALSLSEKGMGGAVAKALGVPLLMPVFPRSPIQYTASLDRQSLVEADAALGRIDLQLIAMVVDARAQLAARGIRTHDEITLVGLSASAHFVNRFTMLHPRSVKAAVAGAVNGILMLPLERIGSAELPYPLGVKDMNSLTGRHFEIEAWKHIPQFIFMGANDNNDWAESDDVYSDAQRTVIFEHLGRQMLPARWQRCQELYREAGANATFRTYEGVGHWTNGAIHKDVAQFLRRASDDN